MTEEKYPYIPFEQPRLETKGLDLINPKARQAKREQEEQIAQHYGFVDDVIASVKAVCKTRKLGENFTIAQVKEEIEKKRKKEQIDKGHTDKGHTDKLLEGDNIKFAKEIIEKWVKHENAYWIMRTPGHQIPFADEWWPDKEARETQMKQWEEEDRKSWNRVLGTGTTLTEL